MPLEQILHVYRQADPLDLKDGLHAYRRYRKIIFEIAKPFHTPARTSLGVFAALSPNNDYHGNLRDLETVLQAWRQGTPYESFRVNTYGPNKLKAWRICFGEDPLLVLPEGKKTWHFYRNLLDPGDPHPVTIDGHMFSVWHGKRFRMDEAKITPRTYQEIAEGFRQAGKDLGKLPNQVQAVCWYTWKRLGRIRFKAQLELWGYR